MTDPRRTCDLPRVLAQRKVILLKGMSRKHKTKQITLILLYGSIPIIVMIDTPKYFFLLHVFFFTYIFGYLHLYVCICVRPSVWTSHDEKCALLPVRIQKYKIQNTKNIYTIDIAPPCSKSRYVCFSHPITNTPE